VGSGHAPPESSRDRSLLTFGGHETQRLFTSVDPFAVGPAVSWAGPGPAPQWLDLAREPTERWHHQQQSREAVGAAPLDDPTLLKPVLATFAFALVPPFCDVAAPDGTTVHLGIEGASGGDWTVARDRGGWHLRVGRPASPDGTVRLSEDTAWRMYVRALARPEIDARSTTSGAGQLTDPIL
jgi:hypothetical protein